MYLAAKKPQNTEKYKQIKADLINQLERNGNNQPIFLDMVDNYMIMWSTAQLLKADIDKRGVSVEYNNGGGQSGLKKNESVELFNKTNAQMLKLLADLKIRPSTNGSIEDETL